MRTDFFNEAIVASMLAAAGGEAPESGPGPETAEPDDPAEVLRERLAALMDRADRAAGQAGLPDELIETADLAVCAFIDETLLSSASWPGREDWMKKPLQFARHGTATAGEDFYRLLDAILQETEKNAPEPSSEDWEAAGPAPREEAAGHLLAVLEIFALCLARGFTGMLYGDPSAIRGRLERIGRFVPAVNRQNFFFVPAEKVKEPRPLRKATAFFRRFDPLDMLLWLVPAALTALFYRACGTRLDQLLESFLRGIS
jgi:type VI protein secretion system component VasF